MGDDKHTYYIIKIDRNILYKGKGNWAQWSEWGQCSKSCGGGIRTRLRNCNGHMGTYPRLLSCFYSRNGEVNSTWHNSGSCNTEGCPS